MNRFAALSSLVAVLGAAGVASSASAQTDTSQVGPFQVTGEVPSICSGGTVGTDTTVFDMGTLVDTATGQLLTNLTAPNKTVSGSFCNIKSTITVSATPMTAGSFVGTPPPGFTNGVDYTATASGWTSADAVFTTDAAANPNASQSRATAFTGTITIGVSAFTPQGGSTLRPVSDPNYQGIVTVTLSVAS